MYNKPKLYADYLFRVKMTTITMARMTITAPNTLPINAAVVLTLCEVDLIFLFLLLAMADVT